MKTETKGLLCTLPIQGNISTGTVVEDQDRFLYVVSKTVCELTEEGELSVLGVNARPFGDKEGREEINFRQGDRMRIISTPVRSM